MSNIENSKLRLQEHQEEAYRNVEKIFENERYAAIIFPTGCGKSFVTLEYMLRHSDEKILVLSPRNAIKDQMYEYVVRYIGGVDLSIEEIKKQYGSMKSLAKKFIPNIECMLYQTIAKIGENNNLDDILEKLNPDLIVVDEMHHLKTRKDELIVDEEEKPNIKRENEWGRKIKELLDRYPNAKVLGLSATPIRSDNVNVVERLFQNRIASEISLLEAIESGIITSPKYITPDFVKEDELESLLEKINETKGNEKIVLENMYRKLAEKSSQAKGIPELLESSIQEKDGKYIVFCKDIKDMEEKAKNAKEWFAKVDKEPEIYMISSKQKDNKEQLNGFNESNSEHIKLLYTVGMINEGVHLERISGVILTSKTESRISYLQKIGRALYSKEEKRPSTIIDLANNNEILYQRQSMDEIYDYEIRDTEALRAAIRWIDEKNEGKLPGVGEKSNFKEKVLIKRLARIKDEYAKYVENPNLLEKLSRERQKEVREIIQIGKEINLWNLEINIDEENKKVDNQINDFLESISIKGVRRELQELLEDANSRNVPLRLQQAREIKKWMNEKDTTKPPSAASKNEDERKLGNNLAVIRRNLIKPYNSLKTREEKGKFERKHPELAEVMQIVNWIDENNISKYLRNAREIKKWMNEKNTTKPPSQSSEDKDERKLGKALSTIRFYLIKPYENLQTEKEKEEYRKKHPELDEVMEIVRNIDERNLPIKLQQARRIKEWMEENKTEKPPRFKAEDETERKLGQALNSIKQDLINPYKELLTNEEKEQFENEHPEIKEILEIVGNIEGKVKESKSSKYLEEIKNIENWYEKNKKIPRRVGKNITKEEKEAGESLHKIKELIIKPYNALETEEEKRDFREKYKGVVEEAIELISIINKGNNLPIKVQQIRNIKTWMEENNTKRPPRGNGKDISEEEAILGQQLHTIREEFIKVYERLKTKEEKEKFIKEHPGAEEIIETVRQIDENTISRRLEKVLEAKKWMKERKTNIPPSSTSKDEDERRLGIVLVNAKYAIIKPYRELKTEEEREAFRKKHQGVEEIIKIVDEIDKNNPKRKKLNLAKQKRDEAKRKNEEAKALQEKARDELSKAEILK